MVENVIKSSPNEVLSMNEVNIHYNSLLGNDEKSQKNFKQYLKKLLENNISDIVFSKPLARNESERLCSKQTQGAFIEETFKNTKENFSTIFDCAKTIRNDIQKSQRWKFHGSFENFKFFRINIPKNLSSLVRWILTGPKDITDTRKKAFDISVTNIYQIIMGSIKSNRQVNYKTVSTTNPVFQKILRRLFQ